MYEATNQMALDGALLYFLACLLACLLKLADSFEWEARLDGI